MDGDKAGLGFDRAPLRAQRRGGRGSARETESKTEREEDET